jgi:uncharacterized protein YggE
MTNKKESTFVVLTGILALGIFAAAFGGMQMFRAGAQTDSEQKPALANAEGQAAPNASDIQLISAQDYSGTPTVSTAGFASTKVKPDKFSVTVGVETNGTTAKEAADRNAELMDKVIAAVKELGISDDQISTSNFNVYPVYSYREQTEPCILIYPPPPECQPKNEITGYHASNSVTVTLDEAGQVDAGEVIDAAVAAGANNVSGVYFFISQERQEQVRDSLIRQSIANARERAEIAADAVGMNVTGVQSIHLNDVYFPVFSRGFDAAVAESTPIMPGEQEITNTVNVVFTLGS